MTILEEPHRIIHLEPSRLSWDWHTNKHGDIATASSVGVFCEKKPPYPIKRTLVFGNQRYCITGGCDSCRDAYPLLSASTKIATRQFSYTGYRIIHQKHEYVLGLKWRLIPRHLTVEEVRYRFRCLYGHGGSFLTDFEPIDTNDEDYDPNEEEYWDQPHQLPSYHSYLRRDHYRNTYRTIHTRPLITQQSVELELSETPDLTTQEAMIDYLNQGITAAPAQLELI